MLVLVAIYFEYGSMVTKFRNKNFLREIRKQIESKMVEEYNYYNPLYS